MSGSHEAKENSIVRSLHSRVWMDLVDHSFQALKSLLLHGHSNRASHRQCTQISADCTDKMMSHRFSASQSRMQTRKVYSELGMHRNDNENETLGQRPNTEHGFSRFSPMYFANFSPLHKLNGQNGLFTVLSGFSKKK